MTYAQGVVLGLVQGLTEFLPVSSSGHLILVPHVFGWPDQGLAFDAVMHLGTLAALLAYFRRELLGMVTGALSRRLAVLLILATIPGALAGVVLEKLIESKLRSPVLIAATTAGWAIVMWIADRRAAAASATPGDPLERVSLRQALAVGCAQALALIPGTSRSGITITTGLLGGFDRATAPGEAGPLAAALVTAFVSGWFAVWFLVSYLKTRSLRPFVVYRLLLALVIFLVVLRG